MLYTRIYYNEEYDIMDLLPRWAYSEKEWDTLMLDVEQVVDNNFLTAKEEPEIDEFADFLDLM